MTVSHKAVTPVKTGVQINWDPVKGLDSAFRRNDTKCHFLSFCRVVKLEKSIRFLCDHKIGYPWPGIDVFFPPQTFIFALSGDE